MQSIQWEKSLVELLEVMRALSVRDSGVTELGSAGLDVLAERTLELARKGGRTFFSDKGATTSNASCFFTDLAKNAGVRTMVFTDSALVTCIGNDFGYEDLFAEPLSYSHAPHRVDAVMRSKALG